MSHRYKILLHIAIAFAGAVIVKVAWEHLQRILPWWPHWVSADVLVVIAIAFAIVQFLDGRQEERALDQQESRLATLADQIQGQAGAMKSISLAIATRFARAFAENLKEIIHLSSQTNRPPKMSVDFPGL